MSNNDDNIFIKYIANKMCVTMTHNPVNINIKKFQESSYDDSEDLRKAQIFVPLNKVS